MNSKLFYKSSIGRVSWGKTILLLGSLAVMLFAIAKINFGAEGGETWPFAVISVFTIWIALYVTCTYFHFGTPYLITSAYVLALGLFHLSIVAQVALGILYVPKWFSESLGPWYELGGWYVVLAMAGIGLGSAIGLFMKSPRPRTEEVQNYLRLKTLRFARSSAIGLLLASLVFFVLAIRSYGNLFSYSRADLYSLGGPDSRGLGVFMMIFPGAVTLFLLSARNRTQRLQGYALGVFAFFLFMFTGYRSAALFPALIGVILWVKIGNNIPKTVAIGMVVSVLVMISVFGIFRKLGTFGELGTEQLAEAYEQSSLSSSFTVLGQTVGIVGHTLRLVPDENEYFYGASYWRAIKGMVPNLGFGVDTSMSRDTIGDMIKAGDKEAFSLLSPSSWMTYHLQYHAFKRGGGVGYSAVAEPYLNFGTGGVLLFFPVLGFLLTRLDTLSISHHPYIFVFCGAMMWPLIRTVRNDFANFLKPLGFMLIILLVWHIAMRIIGKRSI